MTSDVSGNQTPPSASAPRAELLRQSGYWLNQALDIADSAGMDAITARFAALRERSRAAHFRIAFLDEFRRGKSALINRLLDRDLLPTGALPTRPFITSIVTSGIAGRDEWMEVRFSAERQDVRRL